MFGSQILNHLRVFHKREEGSITVEAMLALPVLLWAIAACYTYFEGFRQSAANLKAANTIGDIISRQTDPVNDTYMDSLRELMVLMVNNGTQMDMRVSLITYWDDGVNSRHEVNWSFPRGGYVEQWTDDTIDEIEERLPPMPNADTLILVETRNEYVPYFNVGLGNDITFDNFIFTRPRFTNQIANGV